MDRHSNRLREHAFRLCTDEVEDNINELLGPDCWKQGEYWEEEKDREWPAWYSKTFDEDIKDYEEFWEKKCA